MIHIVPADPKVPGLTPVFGVLMTSTSQLFPWPVRHTHGFVVLGPVGLGAPMKGSMNYPGSSRRGQIDSSPKNGISAAVRPIKRSALIDSWVGAWGQGFRAEASQSTAPLLVTTVPTVLAVFFAPPSGCHQHLALSLFSLSPGPLYPDLSLAATYSFASFSP